MRWGGEAIGREEMEHREKEKPMAETKTSHPWGQEEGEEVLAASGGQGHSSQRRGRQTGECSSPLCPAFESFCSFAQAGPLLKFMPPQHTPMDAHTRNIDTHAHIYTRAPRLKPITFGQCQFKYYLLWKTGQLPAWPKPHFSYSLLSTLHPSSIFSTALIR